MLEFKESPGDDSSVVSEQPMMWHDSDDTGDKT
jgi:hypothetical protein